MADISQRIYKPQNQWAMSAADNEYGMSLPESNQFQTPVPQSTFQISGTEPVEFGVTPATADDISNILQDIFTKNNQQLGKPDDINSALNNLISSMDNVKEKSAKQMFLGAAFKTAAAAGDFLSRATRIIGGETRIIEKQKNIAVQNYQNQMESLDNQMLYLKNQMANRFNQTVETNLMNMAAKNLRVTSGNVLELSKDMAQEMTEDMRMAESNARLKKIALEAGKKSAKESAKYAKTQMWTGFIQSALNLGLMVETGGGTGESWASLYKGYKNAIDN